MSKHGTVFFENRREAGQQLAEKLTNYRGQDVVALGIPRGGVPVAEPIAGALGTELDVIVVKKLGAPGNPELALGAVGEGETVYLNEEVVDSLSVGLEYLSEETNRQYERVRELASEFRTVKDKSLLTDRTVILVDDGIATGSSARACMKIIKEKDPEKLILAVPVAPVRTIREFREDAPVDRIVCLREVEGFFGAIGGYYRDFGQVSSEEVRAMLEEHNTEETNES